MGDRTGCTLTFGGLISREEATRLAEAIETQGPYRMEGRVTTEWILGELISGEATWAFDQVNHGRRAPDLSRALADLGLAWTWSWNWGNDYDPGIEMHDPRSGETTSFATNSDGPLLTFEEALDRPDRLAEARAWRGFSASLRFAVYDSQHRRADLLAADPFFASFA